MAYTKKGKPKKENEKKIVDWFSAKKNMIKLEGEEMGLFLADNVVEASNFEKYPINAGDTVEVGKGKDEDGEPVIVFLRKVKSETSETKAVKAKNSEPSEDNEEADNSEPSEDNEEADNSEATVKTIKIIAVRKDRTAVKIDDSGYWPKIKESLQNNKAINANNEIEVKIVDGVIVAINTDSVKKVEQKAETKKSISTTQPVNRTQNNSIELQVALKESGAIVRSLIEQGSDSVNSVEKVQNVIVNLTKTCYDAMQSV